MFASKSKQALNLTVRFVYVSEYIVDRTGNSKNIHVWAAEWFACSSENGLYTGQIDLYTQLLPWFSPGLEV